MPPIANSDRMSRIAYSDRISRITSDILLLDKALLPCPLSLRVHSYQHRRVYSCETTLILFIQDLKTFRNNYLHRAASMFPIFLNPHELPLDRQEKRGNKFGLALRRLVDLFLNSPLVPWYQILLRTLHLSNSFNAFLSTTSTSYARVSTFLRIS